MDWPTFSVLILAGFASCVSTKLYTNGHVAKKGISNGSYGRNEPRLEIQDRKPIYPFSTCSDQYEFRTGKIIRTDESLSNGAEFLDALTAKGFSECLQKCCDNYDLCDTSIFIEDGYVDENEEVNCFTFRCWIDGDMKCGFAHHEGYVSSIIGGFENQFRDYQVATVSPEPVKQPTTTAYSVVETTRARTTARSTTTQSTTTYQEKQTTSQPPPLPKVQDTEDEQDDDDIQCMLTQFQCGSGECIPKHLYCDNIINCQDRSDENRCRDGGTRNKWDYVGHDGDTPEDGVIVRATQNTNNNGDTNHKPASPAPNRSPPAHVLDESENKQASIQQTGNDNLTPDSGDTKTEEDEIADEDEGNNKDKQNTDEDGVVPKDKTKDKPPGDADQNHPIEGQGLKVVKIEEIEVLQVATSAVFPLVVGLLLTSFLLLMVGCRLRYMNRRLRYGRVKNHAHDADYLINGMYL